MPTTDEDPRTGQNPPAVSRTATSGTPHHTAERSDKMEAGFTLLSRRHRFLVPTLQIGGLLRYRSQSWSRAEPATSPGRWLSPRTGGRSRCGMSDGMRRWKRESCIGPGA